MTINELAKKTHESTAYRGILDKYKTVQELKKATAEKAMEEVIEFVYSMPSSDTDFHKDSEQSEIADIILVMLTYAHDSEYDIEKILSDKLKYNEKRVD